MESYIMIGLIAFCSLFANSAAISCYTCLYMEVQGGGSYGDSHCKKNGPEYEDGNTQNHICTKRENIIPRQVYFNTQVRWDIILSPGEADGFEDWRCSKSVFTMSSSESNLKVDVWYRGCEPVQAEECYSGSSISLREGYIFNQIYNNISATDAYADRVKLDGTMCTCKYYICNAAATTSRDLTATAMATTAIAILLRALLWI